MDPSVLRMQLPDAAHPHLRSSSEDSAASPTTGATTPIPSSTDDNLNHYIPLGCLHLPEPLVLETYHCESPWTELSACSLSERAKANIGKDATKLLAAQWIRLFLYQGLDSPSAGRIVRLYLLPEDWGRRTIIDRGCQSLKKALRQLLHHVDVSPAAWSGEYREEDVRYFDPWATAEDVSLFYLFNKLPSPAPDHRLVKNRYSRNAVIGLLDAASASQDGDVEQFIPGLKSKLYPYQARSAALMLQREAAPQLQLDPRLEVRETPTGEKYYFGARDGSFMQEPRYYESNRGGILAETMGLGKTVICLALILATRGHMPQIPPAYHEPTIRPRVGSLGDMVASTIARKAIPASAYLSILEAEQNIDLQSCKQMLGRNMPHYYIPAVVPRLSRSGVIPPAQKLSMCGGTIVVVPGNLLNQWQNEIQKHVTRDGLRVLVMLTRTERAKNVKQNGGSVGMDVRTDLPQSTDLLKYDVILFTRNRFEWETRCDLDIMTAGFPSLASNTFVRMLYSSPLKELHWLRIIIDEGHNLSSGLSNAVILARQLHVERRWVVSGTPAKNLVGVELEMFTEDPSDSDPVILRGMAMEQRKEFKIDDEDNTKAAKALGSLASGFLMVRPWAESASEIKLEWTEYIYRHEHQYRKTNSGFSSCFLRVLEGLVVKTRPEDVERDIQLPPMRHRTVFLKPCWYDKMTSNLFIQVLRANAITSEREGVDYLFHKSSAASRHTLLRNLRQSHFAWTGFSAEDVVATLETTIKYLKKEDKNCTPEDAATLLESSSIILGLLESKRWLALSEAHEVGLAVEGWSEESREQFSLAIGKPSLIGATQLLEGQSLVDHQILSDNPAEGLENVLNERTDILNIKSDVNVKDGKQFAKAAVPSSCLSDSPVKSRKPKTAFKSPMKNSSPSKPAKASLLLRKHLPDSPRAQVAQHSRTPNNIASQSSATPESTDPPVLFEPTHHDRPSTPAPSPTRRPKKRKLTLADETASLPASSSLLQTHLLGTTSAKLTYLLDTVIKYHETDKILIFYDGDNAAYYLAQTLELLYINHRIYARTLDNVKRSEYIALFNIDPDVRVLLIDVACGALGLNLNAASIVLIVNPINRPGLEAQAIKRAHRIGQSKEVRVETLVLEGTIEEKIFRQAKRMSRMQHAEAKTLEDDDEIAGIIQNAEVLPVEEGEGWGLRQYALLGSPQQVFGREGRERYDRFGSTEKVKGEEEKKGRPVKRVRESKGKKKAGDGSETKMTSPAVAMVERLDVPRQSLFGSGMDTQ
ncbi:hypothetical protein M011DRAFT_475825 [Sporormia fimetaria CBS 119925]|uniref:Helicase C-terminal domain-containing protein n=1 Tax=Sporormia fimetaria CBS 119925 TaxID=1340428 RepID=A0A6A6VH10_9PLEO|nr:hypothetical protein M011DRAFT_475825 [Sporormia fimetaria CBS 119925]